MSRTVCVALPVKNGSAYLAEAIESVLAQDGVDLTVRVIDNRSDDDSLEIAQAYAERDPRLTAERNPVDVFYYGSLNRALAGTDAEYFVPFAHDDVMQPGNLRLKVDALEETGAAFATSTCLQIDEHGAVRGLGPDHRATPRVTQAPEFFRHLAPVNAVACQSVVARTTALKDIGGFDGRSFYAGDWLTWMRLALRSPVVALAEPLTAYRVHAAAGTRASNAGGLNARDVPSTLDLAFRDEAMPAQWRARWRDEMVASSHVKMALELHDVGLRRAGGGWASYVAMGRALVLRPSDAELRVAYATLIRSAGLHVPDLPADAVATAPATATEAEALAAAAHDLGPLLGRLVIAADPSTLDVAMPFLDAVFGEADLDVLVLPTDDVGSLLTPGRLALAEWGGEGAARAEAAGVPVFPYAMPDPFAAPPDADRWETVDAARCVV